MPFDSQNYFQTFESDFGHPVLANEANYGVNYGDRTTYEFGSYSGIEFYSGLGSVQVGQPISWWDYLYIDPGAETFGYSANLYGTGTLTSISSTNPMESSLSAGSGDFNDPFMPIPIASPTPPGSGWRFVFPVVPGQVGFVDPDIAVGYDYAVNSGPNFASVLLPNAGRRSLRLVGLGRRFKRLRFCHRAFGGNGVQFRRWWC